jgi:hypothetical protein
MDGRASDVIERIRAEYRELPTLRLTLPQAQRLWGLDSNTCVEVLTELVEMKFLRRTRDGSFVRADVSRPAAGRQGFGPMS